jgi:hypothetical protein
MKSCETLIPFVTLESTIEPELYYLLSDPRGKYVKSSRQAHD